jgi:transcriptional regulator with XRE-family HTH domain
MDVGSKIRFLREKHGLKQINLANALQVSPQAVSKWEKGANLPDIPIILKIAKLFDVTTDYLLGTTDAGSGVFEATVFCSGIAHFAQRSISMNSKEMADYTNVLFYHLTESVLKFDGVPVKYVGDGFLCFFSGPDHADRALQSAIHAKKIIYQKELVISLNTGNIYLGMIGHPQYAFRDIVGETINRAFLIIEWISKNCPSGIGATEAAIKRVNQYFDTILHHGIRIPLIDEVVDIYEISTP